MYIIYFYNLYNTYICYTRKYNTAIVYVWKLMVTNNENKVSYFETLMGTYILFSKFHAKKK